MRILFFAFVAALQIINCIQGKVDHIAFSNASFDLSEPIYLIPDLSFFSGCNQDSAGEKICHDLRIGQIRCGIEKWAKYFRKDQPLQLMIINSESDLPIKRKNRFIYLKIAPGLWQCAGHPACYYDKGMDNQSNPVIAFDGFANITCGFAQHEIGHVLGRDDNDVPISVCSVMSYAKPVDVTDLDFQMVLNMHPEVWD